VGVVSALEYGPVQLSLLADVVQGPRQAARPCEGVEGHAIVPLDMAAHRPRVDAPYPEIAIGDAHRRIPVDLGQQTRRPSRLAVQVQGSAALAGAVPGDQGRLGGRVVLDVLRQGFTRRTGGAAEDPRAAHAQEEDPIVRGVSIEIGLLHLAGGGQAVHRSSLLATGDLLPPNFRRECGGSVAESDADRRSFARGHWRMTEIGGRIPQACDKMVVVEIGFLKHASLHHRYPRGSSWGRAWSPGRRGPAVQTPRQSSLAERDSRIALRPCHTMNGTMARAATGSAHHHPRAEWSARPSRRAADR